MAGWSVAILHRITATARRRGTSSKPPDFRAARLGAFFGANPDANPPERKRGCRWLHCVAQKTRPELGAANVYAACEVICARLQILVSDLEVGFTNFPLNSA